MQSADMQTAPGINCTIVTDIQSYEPCPEGQNVDSFEVIITRQMKIVADMNMPGLEETFGQHGELVRLEGRGIGHPDMTDADVLLVRSVTGVNASLLKGTRVRFVGSATIGIDHLDTRWLEANDITWAHAPGCNANAAAQYTLAMMWLACQRLGKELHQQQVGIVGRGNVGRRLQQLLLALGIKVAACDPPLEDQGKTNLVSMAEACANNIISLHIPLTPAGKHPTKDLFDHQQLGALKPGTLLVNASRGGVIEKSALYTHLRSGHIHAALDVWPDEPFIESELLDLATTASPHIAGYSREGKHAGTEMIYQAFCNTFKHALPKLDNHSDDVVDIGFPPATPIGEILQRLIESSCPVARDDEALRALTSLQINGNRIQIDVLRSNYPDRREFKSHHVSGVTDNQALQLQKMGFRTT
jgi:erythronate-4-phosphate dehydrogenase